MHVIIACKYKKERMSREIVATPFFPIIPLSVTMGTSGWIWPNFELIQALMYVINTCKYEKDLIKNHREKVETLFSPIISLWGFFRRSRTANSSVSGPIRLDLAEFRTHPSSHVCYEYLQV